VKQTRRVLSSALMTALVVATGVISGEHPGQEHPGAEHPGQEHPGKQAGSGTARKEHPGKRAGSGSAKREHPGDEHPGHSALPSRQEMREGMKAIVDRSEDLSGGFFLVFDRKTGDARVLRHQKVHDRLAVIEGPVARKILSRSPGGARARRSLGDEKVYFACNDFEDVKTGETVDVDVWMVRHHDDFVPARFAIHKVDGKPRFTYQDDEIQYLDE